MMLSFNSVSYSYGSTPAIRDVSFGIGEGEFACLIGGNGSGKSTLARLANALLLPDRGTVSYRGRESSDPAALPTLRSQVGMVFQNPDDQLVASIVENEVAFGPENLGLPRQEIRSRVSEALARVGLEGFEAREVAQLSGGQKQRLALAGVLALRPRVVVLDEADAMLDPQGRIGLLGLCEELSASGVAVLLATHSMELAAHAHRVLVIDAGKIVADGAPQQVLANAAKLEQHALEPPFAIRLCQALEQRGLTLNATPSLDALTKQLRPHLQGRTPATPATPATPEPQAPRPGNTPPPEPLLACDKASFTYAEVPDGAWALDQVSFSLAKGDALGVAGSTGSGKSTLAQLTSGLLAAQRGEVRFQGSSLAGKEGSLLARRNLGLMLQYPERQLFAATVFEDVAFGPRNAGVPAHELEGRVFDALRKVGLDPEELAQRSPFALSGGQQRRVALAGILAMQPAVLILDEPTAGLDPKSRRSFIELLGSLLCDGCALVLISHDMAALAELCEHMIILHQGKVQGSGPARELLSDKALLERCSLALPPACACAAWLAEQDVPVPFAGVAPSVDELASAIAASAAI